MSSNPIDSIEALQSMRDLADTVFEFYKHLRDKGLRRDEALPITQTWLQAIILRQVVPDSDADASDDE